MAASSPIGRPQGFDARGLVAAMGSVARERAAARAARPPAARPVVDSGGLARLAGRDRRARRTRRPRPERGARRALSRRLGRLARADRPAAFVAGDRQVDGVFPLWSVALERHRLGPAGHDAPGSASTAAAEARLRRRMARAARDPGRRRWGRRSLSLSGGNQQKALFARALGSRRAAGADGRPDARRRHRHQAGGLRPPARRGGRRAGPSSGTRPRWTRSASATGSTSSARAPSSPSWPGPR